MPKPTAPDVSPLRVLTEQWSDCRRCTLHRTRTRFVMCRGEFPCDVLFAGEAPGRSEDITGQPFTGPAGDELGRITAQAVPAGVTLGYVNLLACIPLSDGRVCSPPAASVGACRPRVEELVWLASPKLLVLLGKEPVQYMGESAKIPHKLPAGLPRLEMVHPAIVARQDPSMRAVLRRRCVAALAGAIEEFVVGRT